MKYPTPADIAEMKARGENSETIAEAERKMELGVKAETVIRVIDAAFDGVQLGKGIGLWEAQGIDDYEDEATCAAYQLKDEKEDWRSIPAETLNRCDSSPSFFDAEGMRFHLPAFMIMELRREHNLGICYNLTCGADSLNQFHLLSPEQRAAVRLFLQHIAEDPDYAFDRPHILQALEGFWQGDGPPVICP